MSPEIDFEVAAAEICELHALELRGELGRGAFKRAYLAQAPQGEVALKLAPIFGSAERLIREAEALRGCSHPNIATLIDAFPTRFHDTDMWVVVEQYVPGGTLEKRMAQSRLSLEAVRALGLALADALDHLDQRRLVHRDIKPANILFDSDGATPVLTDFGVVRMLDLPTLTRDFVGLGPGTPAYAAPEQLNNEKSLIDWRTDQFDLALVLGECVLDRHPFVAPGQTIHSAIANVAARYSLPDQSRLELEELGFGVLVQALSPWPVSRYRRPSDFIEALGG